MYFGLEVVPLLGTLRPNIYYLGAWTLRDILTPAKQRAPIPSVLDQQALGFRGFGRPKYILFGYMDTLNPKAPIGTS